MCGIAGELNFRGAPTSPQEIDRVNQRQQHRGPDGSGMFRLDRMTLGHQRLKIFDLSDRAAQPMVDPALGLGLVFNGAIYNFPDLRRELEQKGYRFISESDTEVLLKAYHCWGPECVTRLCGMFAFAVWERDSGKLVLARDRMGIKPLYYTGSADGFRFASTLPGLLEFDSVDTGVDPVGLFYYLTFHAVPEPYTILSGIRKLAPGAILTVYPDGRMDERSYWSFRLQGNEGEGGSEGEWLEATHEALTTAVNRQLAADVPVGVLLSGGLDSSLMVALAAERLTVPVETFSIGFEKVGDEEGDEFVYSDLIAAHFNTRHHRMFIPTHELVDALPDCVRAMSEPMTSHDNIGFYLLSREVAKHVKVVLSGQGADELFAGYHWFQAIARKDTADVSGLLAQTLSDHTPQEYQDTVTREFQVPLTARDFFEQRFVQDATRTPIYPLLEYESTTALANGPLGRMDNMSMASSLEARVPFLDEAVVDLSLRMPLSCKLPDDGKFILKQLGRQMLPREVVDRKKGYFPVPALKYLEGSTLELMQEVLSPERVKRRGIFNPAMVSRLLEEPHAHVTPTGGSKLWQIGLLEMWLEQQGLG